MDDSIGEMGLKLLSKTVTFDRYLVSVESVDIPLGFNITENQKVILWQLYFPDGEYKHGASSSGRKNFYINYAGINELYDDKPVGSGGTSKISYTINFRSNDTERKDANFNIVKLTKSNNYTLDLRNYSATISVLVRM